MIYLSNKFPSETSEILEKVVDFADFWHIFWEAS